MAEKRIPDDVRPLRIQYDTKGSPTRPLLNVNEENPSPQTLIQKPFGFKYNPVTSRTTDVQRFTKFLGTASGGRFQANYAILQQSQQELNRKVASASREGGTGFGNLLRRTGARLLGTFLGNVGFTANLAKQIAVNGTGTHFINNTSGNFYIDDTGGSGGGVAKQLFKSFIKNTLNLDSTGFKGKLGFDPEGTGLVESKFAEKGGDGETKLKGKSKYVSKNDGGDFDGPKPGGITFGSITDGIIGTNELTDTGVGFAESGPLLGNYNKVYGDGVSGLRDFSKDSVDFDESKIIQKSYSKGDNTNDFSYGPGDITITNVEKKIERSTSQTRLQSIVTGSTEVTVENPLVLKVGVGNNNIARQDFIESTTLDIQLEDEEAIQEAYGEQLIPFSITSLTPDNSYTLLFNAFLDSYSDSFQGNWNGTQYIGRAEEFYTYQGFSRDINFAFKVAAFRKEDLNPMYRKLNMLAGTTAPSYSAEGNYMRGTLTRITIGDLLFRQNGYISGIDLSWSTTYPWEIDVDKEKKVSKVPHLLDVSVQFTPIHNFNVKSDLDFVKGQKYFGTKLNKADVVVGEHKIDKLSFSEETLNNSGYTREFQG